MVPACPQPSSEGNVPNYIRNTTSLPSAKANCMESTMSSEGLQRTGRISERLGSPISCFRILCKLLKFYQPQFPQVKNSDTCFLVVVSVQGGGI